MIAKSDGVMSAHPDSARDSDPGDEELRVTDWRSQQIPDAIVGNHGKGRMELRHVKTRCPAVKHVLDNCIVPGLSTTKQHTDTSE